MHRRPRRLPSATALLLALAGALAALAPAATAAETVGTASPWWTGAFSTTAISPGQTVFNLTDTREGSQLAAPADGVITRWRTEEFSGQAVVQLQVVREASAGSWQIVASGPVQTRADVLSTSSGSGVRYVFPARIPIAAGDQLALHQADLAFSYFFGGQADPSLTTATFADKGVGSPAAAPAQWMDPGSGIGLNADVEPDVDGDGWGDETQDTCVGVDSQDQTDTDGDGQGDVCDADDDGDGLDDGDEPTHGADPLDPDSDGDGLLDGDEVDRGTDPTLADSDGDGFDDAVEIALGTDPLDPDGDGDGVLDGVDHCPTTAGAGSDGCPVAPVAQPAATPTVDFVTPASDLRPRDPRTGIEIELAISHAGPGDVRLLVGDREVCRWASAPYRCTWRPDGASVGRRTLVAAVPDASGGVAIAHRAVRVARFAPAGLTAVASTARLQRFARATVSGDLKLPDAVEARDGCRGVVRIGVVRGKRVLVRRLARVDGDCSYTRDLRLPPWVRDGDRLRVRTAFIGNAALARERGPVVRTRVGVGGARKGGPRRLRADR